MGKKLVLIPDEPKLLLGPNTPKPMHGLTPRNLLGSKWWNKTRRKAYRSTGYRCLACGVLKFNAKGRQWLEAHEVYEIDYLLGRSYYRRAVPLCHYCHCYIHSGRLAAQLEKGEISHAKYTTVIQHGDRVLSLAGLEPRSSKEDYSGLVADWSDWRLVIEGKEYPPKFKTFKQWKAVFNVNS